MMVFFLKHPIKYIHNCYCNGVVVSFPVQCGRVNVDLELTQNVANCTDCSIVVMHHSVKKMNNYLTFFARCLGSLLSSFIFSFLFIFQL